MTSFTRSAERLELNPGGFAQCLRSDPNGCTLALLGLPDDTGVELNGGRTGAAKGPAAFRRALAKLSTNYDAATETVIDVPIFDAGDVVPSDLRNEDGLRETHARVRSVTRELHERGMITACIGGGHDLSLPTIGALAESCGKATGGINVDAHLDVRERVGSGMPFRALIEAGALDPARFIEYGLGRFANERGDTEWARTRGVRCLYVDGPGEPKPLRPEALLHSVLAGGVGFFSIDLDSIDQGFAPGVSAPSPCGLSPGAVVRFAIAAGSDPRVRHFDIMELCPRHDEGGRTARLAARLFLAFVTGFVGRPR